MTRRYNCLCFRLSASPRTFKVAIRTVFSSVFIVKWDQAERTELTVLARLHTRQSSRTVVAYCDSFSRECGDEDRGGPSLPFHPGTTFHFRSSCRSRRS